MAKKLIGAGENDIGFLAPAYLHLDYKRLFMRKILWMGIVALCVTSAATLSAQPLKPYGALPTAAQLRWQDMETYMFVHFGPNTFTDKEWGSGTENPDVFNPTDLDCRQWARTAVLAGMKGIVITAKHHDGFCLWPSRYSTHTVAQSSWEGGHGDVLRALSEACREYGIGFGVYLSPWDRNHPAYGTAAYNGVFADMLKEIYARYGPVFEQWFDGAKGTGPGVKPQQYDWKLYDGTVDSLQPGCVIFSDVGPGARWVGNEKGYAGKTNWCTLNTKGFTPGKGAPPQRSLNHGDEGGASWVPAESDVSIRPGWFYSPQTNDKVKTVAELAEIYYATVGRNANLILNVPADRRGHISPEDSVALMGFRKWRSESFHDNLAVYSHCTASDTRGNNPFFAAANLTDGNPATYWAADDGTTTVTLTLTFAKPVTFNNLVIREFIRLGQRVKAFDLEALRDGKYVRVASGTTIGHKRILCFGEVTSDHVRVHITASLAPPAIAEIGLYKAVVLKGMNPDGETGD